MHSASKVRPPIPLSKKQIVFELKPFTLYKYLIRTKYIKKIKKSR